jgi:hypothetical protein
MKPFLIISIWIFLSVPVFLSCQKNVSDHGGRINGGIISSNAVVTKEYFISPSTTDPAITSFNSSHYATVQEGGVLKNILFVFLPGTNRTPSVCKAMTQKAASLGYHGISLMYANATAGNPICSPTNDTTCHRRLRLEVIDGIDRHPSVNVNPTNSIINRLYKLLVYLNKTYPTQNWGQYILNGKPDWSKIMVSGHSQGAALAGVIGKFYPIKKVIMISMIDFLANGKIPDWEKNPANKEKYFGLINMNDELVPWPKVKAIWTATGWLAYGTYINVDWNAPPYGNTHALVSTYNPPITITDKYHNMTGVDPYIPKYGNGKYIYDQAWTYMLNK